MGPDYRSTHARPICLHEQKSAPLSCLASSLHMQVFVPCIIGQRVAMNSTCAAVNCTVFAPCIIGQRVAMNSTCVAVNCTVFAPCIIGQRVAMNSTLFSSSVLPSNTPVVVAAHGRCLRTTWASGTRRTAAGTCSVSFPKPLPCKSHGKGEESCCPRCCVAAAITTKPW